MTSAAPGGRPVTPLVAAFDDLFHALLEIPQLEELIEGIRLHEEAASQISVDFPGAVDILAGTELRRALINVASEVLAIRKEVA